LPGIAEIHLEETVRKTTIAKAFFRMPNGRIPNGQQIKKGIPYLNGMPFYFSDQLKA
jgi:hypothetical protein